MKFSSKLAKIFTKIDKTNCRKIVTYAPKGIHIGKILVTDSMQFSNI